MNMNEIFDDNGNFREKRYDPWRVDERFKTIHNALFDEYGFLKQVGEYEDWVERKLLAFVSENYLHWNCDAIKLYHAHEFSTGTKGQYGANTAWR